MLSVLAEVERSGLIEEYHEGAVAVADREGRVIAVFGDVDRPYFIRSAAKPFQVAACLEAGLELSGPRLAVACASHSGDPVHVALVDSILAGAGRSEADLRCPPARPFPASDRRLAASGDSEPSRRYHNCSGKHAAMIAACVAAGWDVAAYVEPDHPLQRRMGEILEDATGDDQGPPGVDGCGAPVWRVTTRGLARAFSRLAVENRFGPVREVMSRYPMLVSGEGRPDGRIGRWLGAPVKGGAAGCMGAAVTGFGIGAKAWSGSGAVAAMGVTTALGWLGVAPSIAGGIDEVASPPVLGGERAVGRYRAAAVLKSL